MSTAKKIVLQSCDGDDFEVDWAVAQVIVGIDEDDCVDNGVPIPNVTSKILAKVIEYCKKHVDAAASKSEAADVELKAWDAEFMKTDPATLLDLIRMSLYLRIDNLFNLTCQTVDDMIEGKTPDEVRTMFNIKNV